MDVVGTGLPVRICSLFENGQLKQPYKQKSRPQLSIVRNNVPDSPDDYNWDMYDFTLRIPINVATKTGGCCHPLGQPVNFPGI